MELSEKLKEKYRKIGKQMTPPILTPEQKRMRHIGCPSYPNCKDAPMGCKVRQGDDVEFYGHRG